MSNITKQKIIINGDEFEYDYDVTLDVNVNSTGCLVITNKDELVLALNSDMWRSVAIKWEEVEK